MCICAHKHICMYIRAAPRRICRHYEFPRFQKTGIPFACWSFEGRRGDIVMKQGTWIPNLYAKGVEGP